MRQHRLRREGHGEERGRGEVAASFGGRQEPGRFLERGRNWLSKGSEVSKCSKSLKYVCGALIFETASSEGKLSL